jgi:hypothetical protein
MGTSPGLCPCDLNRCIKNKTYATYLEQRREAQMKSRTTILLGIATIAAICVFWWMTRSEGPLRNAPPAKGDRNIVEPGRIPMH